MQSNALLRSDVGSTDKLMGNNNNLNNNGSPGAHIMFPMEDEGLTQLGSVFQSAYQSIVDGGPQVSDRGMPSVIYQPKSERFESLRKGLGSFVPRKSEWNPPLFDPFDRTRNANEELSCAGVARGVRVVAEKRKRSFGVFLRGKGSFP